jgi:hypothetical protein
LLTTSAIARGGRNKEKAKLFILSGSQTAPFKLSAKEAEMEPLNLPSEMVASKLCEAIERLQRDIVQVEIWAGALTGFAQPIPRFEDAGTYRLRPLPKAK